MGSRTAYRQTPNAGYDMDSDPEYDANAELLRLLSGYAPIVFLANLSASIALAVGLWPVVRSDWLTAWFVTMLLFNAARWMVSRRYAARPPETAAVSRQERLFLYSAFLSGLLWGSSATFFYLPEHPTHSMFLALVLIAMAAASAALLSFHRLAYPIFALPTVAPLAVRLLGEDMPTHIALGAVIPIYFSLLFVLSREIHRFAHEAIRDRLLRERHALLDQLTALANRRAFDEFLHDEWRRAQRTQRPLSLIIADIDDFKRCNDAFGHPVGDAVLRAVGGIFAQAARRGGDLVARIGGEEFAVIAPETDQQGALTIARNIQAALKTVPEKTLQAALRPTVSIGICSITPCEFTSAEMLFKDADAALYKSKADGKNKITLCSGNLLQDQRNSDGAKKSRGSQRTNRPA